MYNDILPYPYIHGTAEYIVSTLQDLCNNNQIHGGNFIVVISKQMDNEYSVNGCLLGSNNGDISSMMEMANNAAWGVSNGILQRLVDLLYLVCFTTREYNQILAIHVSKK